MPNSRLDRWVQRAAVAAMVTLALTLLGVGVALYGAPAKASIQDDHTTVVGR
jgi:hypothetical protein